MNRRPLQRYVDNSIVIGGDGGPTASDRARFAEVVQFLAARCSVSGLELAPRQHKLNFVIVDLPRDGTFTLTTGDMRALTREFPGSVIGSTTLEVPVASRARAEGRSQSPTPAVRTVYVETPPEPRSRGRAALEVLCAALYVLVALALLDSTRSAWPGFAGSGFF